MYKSYILDLEWTQPCCSWRLHHGFVPFFWVFPHHPPGLSQSAQNIPDLGKQVFARIIWRDLTTPTDQPQSFWPAPHPHASSTSHYNASVATLGVPRQLWRVTQHLLLVPCSLPVATTEGMGDFEAVALIYETCLGIWLLAAVVLTQ